MCAKGILALQVALYHSIWPDLIQHDAEQHQFDQVVGLAFIGAYPSLRVINCPVL